MVDITQHLKKCIRIQRRNQLLPDLLNAVNAFQSTLKLFQQQWSTGNMIQFKNMSSFILKTQADLVLNFKKYAKKFEDFVNTFQNAFKNRKTQINSFQRLFSVDVDNVNDAHAQLELLDLRSNEALHDTFQENS